MFFKYVIITSIIMDNTILKHALLNALKFSGKANPKSLVGNVIGEHPEAKKDMKGLMTKIDEIVSKVNSMTLDEQKSELKRIAPDYEERLEEKKKEHKEVKDELKELDDVDKAKGVIMRFAPSPSGPMHIGHAITGGITCLYVRKYGGKFILRIEDTNSDNIDPDAYKMIPQEAEWLFGNVSEVWIQSDRMQIYYDYTKKLIELGSTYVCTCSQEEFKKHADNQENCPCRDIAVQDNIIRWDKMFDKNNGFKEGEAVVRFKSNMQDKNPAMRDFPLVRINDSTHPRQGAKYRVWPLMNLCVTVDDIEAGMTHIIRAKDHADNAKRQEMMYKVLDKKIPKTYFLGRYNFEGLEISCSKTKAKIKECEFSGWDDIRLPFMAALRRRGYQAEAFLKYTRLTGLSPVDKSIPGEEFFKTLNAFNKEIIDSKSKRFFFIEHPHKILVEGAPNQHVELDLQPDNMKGGRKFTIENSFFVEKKDYDLMHNDKMYRLMDALNFKKEAGKLVYVSKTYDDFKGVGEKIIHWLPEHKNLLQVEILMPDNTTKKGIAEHTLTVLKVGETIQFERFGFCRLDAIEGNVYKFWYTHK